MEHTFHSNCIMQCCNEFSLGFVLSPSIIPLYLITRWTNYLFKFWNIAVDPARSRMPSSATNGLVICSKCRRIGQRPANASVRQPRCMHVLAAATMLALATWMHPTATRRWTLIAPSTVWWSRSISIPIWDALLWQLSIIKALPRCMRVNRARW